MQWFDGDAVPKIADAACQSEVHYLNFKRKMEMAKKEIATKYISYLSLFYFARKDHLFEVKFSWTMMVSLTIKLVMLLFIVK